jgi:hypothetical protein
MSDIHDESWVYDPDGWHRLPDIPQDEPAESDVLRELEEGRAEEPSDGERHREIGALVERMMSDPRSVALRFGSAVDLTDGSEYVDAILWYRAAEESGRTQSYGQGGTLLEALRALAKEVGCE